ncbi:hypothetical protein [Haloarchaeobius amylolyticus]|uniref:hypothetical protein n=1 Tax=Haloarchaeobius amylolyticus TaxID=1198296 RepID=UPI002271B035|nr:hypothetical protein [Haloarchaeobius amylolyticus]
MTGDRTRRLSTDDADATRTAGEHSARATQPCPPRVDGVTLDAVLTDTDTDGQAVVVSWAASDSDGDLADVTVCVIGQNSERNAVTVGVEGEEAAGTTAVGVNDDARTTRSGRVLVRVTARDETGATATAIRPVQLDDPRV